MKTTLRNRIKNIIAGILLVIMGLFIANNVVFLHTHILANGVVIVHAHPYDKSNDPGPLKKHHHTDEQYYQISHLQLLFFVSFFLIIVLFFEHIRKYFYTAFTFYPVFHLTLKGRSPPFKLLFS